MKTMITLLTVTVLVAGATSAMAADRQASDDAANNDLSWQVARGFSAGGAFASARVPSGARAQVRVPVQTRTYMAPRDFQLDGGRN